MTTVESACDLPCDLQTQIERVKIFWSLGINTCCLTRGCYVTFCHVCMFQSVTTNAARDDGNGCSMRCTQ